MLRSWLHEYAYRLSGFEMRILQVSPYFSPYVGGQERYVKCLAKALVDRGNTVDILTSNYPKCKKQEIIDGIKVKRFEVLCRPLNNPISPEFLSYFTKHRNEYDVIHTHNEHAFVSQCCSMLRPNSRVPLIVSCHGQLRFGHFAKDLIESAYSRSMGAKVLMKADIVTTLSNADKNYISSLGVPAEKIKVIPNGLNIAETKSPRESSYEKALFERNQVVLFVGPIVRRKGPHVLIRAIPQVMKECSNVVFVFVGNGDFKEEAIRLSHTLDVKEHTFFPGYVTNSQLRYLYQRSDVFVLPSLSEGFPYTILDAFAFSKPVVSTLIPCFKEYLTESALLVQPGDFEGLAHSIVRVLKDKKLAGELGAKGLRLIETRFSWDVVVSEVLSIYREVLTRCRQ